MGENLVHTIDLNHQEINELLNRLKESNLNQVDREVIMNMISLTLENLDGLNQP